MEVELLNRQKKYDLALSVLDSINGCGFGGDCSARDSLKVVTLFLKFGKERIKQSFNKITSLNSSEYPDLDRTYWVLLDDLNFKFIFNCGYIIDIDDKKNVSEKSRIDFYDIAKSLSFYKLLE